MSTITRFAEGEELTGRRRVATERRIHWYGSGFMTANAGEPRVVQTNIHTDDEFAQNQGLPAAIADGMMSANYISSLLVDAFGADFVRDGYLRTKFIKPVYVDEVLTPKAKITSASSDGSTTVYELDVWCEDVEGVKRTTGAARVTVPGQ